MMARLGSLTPLALVSARPARVCRYGAHNDKSSLVGRRVTLVTSHSVDAPENHRGVRLSREDRK